MSNIIYEYIPGDMWFIMHMNALHTTQLRASEALQISQEVYNLPNVMSNIIYQYIPESTWFFRVPEMYEISRQLYNLPDDLSIIIYGYVPETIWFFEYTDELH